MTNGSEPTNDQWVIVEDAYAEWLRREHAWRVFQQAEARWTEAFKTVWDNNDGDGALWAAFSDLRDRDSRG